MTLTQSYEAQRDLLTGQVYKRGGTRVAERLYTYNALGIPTTRRTARQGTVRNDTFGYNARSELASAELGTAPYAYAYDNDADGCKASWTNTKCSPAGRAAEAQPMGRRRINQTRIRTSTGIWTAAYNAQNRPVRFTRENADGTRTVITAAYDYLGRRAWKKVETIATDAETGEETVTVTLHQRYIYRGYLQVAACDLTRGGHPCLWLITWDPTQPIATRPLALQKDGTWYCYGWDLTKNICEVFGQAGYIRTTYSYSPYGTVTEEGDVTQPLQWSSEYADPELGLIYYNYRYYNPRDGRWIRRDILKTTFDSFIYLNNSSIGFEDYLGLISSLHVGVIEGVTSGKITIEEAITLVGGIATLISLAKAKGLRVICKPCMPSVGTKMEQKHTTHTHNKICPHYHVFTVMQSPPLQGCRCFAPKKEYYSVSQGYQPYVKPIGGGIEII